MRNVTKAALKVLHPLVLLAATFFLAAYLLSNNSDNLSRLGLNWLSDTITNQWIVIVLVVVGVLFTFMTIVRLYTWIQVVVFPRMNEKWFRSRTDHNFEENDLKDVESVQRELDALDNIFSIASSILQDRWNDKGTGCTGMPWYFVIGPKGVGKTELINISGLSFSLDHEIASATARFRGTKAHELLHWRIAGNHAVLFEIDLAWVDTTEDDAELRDRLWRRCLENIRMLRPRKPMNGFVVVLDTAKFADATYKEVEDLTIQLRRRISEAANYFDTRMTLQVVFSQMDRIIGFADTFSMVTPEIRAGLAGIEFTIEDSTSGAWPEAFDIEFERISQRIGLHVRDLLPQLSSTNSRQAAISFVQSFTSLRGPILEFLKKSFAADSFTKMPELTGVYFTSVKQKGDLRNILLTKVASEFRQRTPVYSFQKSAPLSYFTKNFWSEAVFARAYRTGVSNKERSKARRRIMLIGCGGTIIVIFLLKFWNDQFDQQVDLMRQIAANSEELAYGDYSAKPDKTGHVYLNTLDIAGAPAMTLGDYWEKAWPVSFVKLDKSARIGLIADKFYLKLLSTKFIPALLSGLETAMIAPCQKGTNRQLQALKVYRMLGESENRDPSVIQNYFLHFWQNAFPGQAPVQEALMRHLVYALKASSVSYALDYNVISSVQSDLKGQLPHIRIFNELENLAGHQSPGTLKFQSQIGVGFGRVYVERSNTNLLSSHSEVLNKCSIDLDKDEQETASAIPQFYTKIGFNDFFSSKLELASQLAAEDLWVLGLSETNDYSLEDLEVVREELRNVYITEYINAWREALHGIDVRAFSDFPDAIGAMREFSGRNSPLRRLLLLVRDQTNIYEQYSSKIVEDEAGPLRVALSPAREGALRIFDEFQEFHNFLNANVETKASSIEDIMQAIGRVADYLEEIQNAPSPQAKSLEYAKNRISLRGEDPIFELRQIATRTPSPFDGHLTKLADEAWRLILKEAARELDRIWQRTVYRHFEAQVMGFYPVDRHAEREMSLKLFKHFFAPDGVLQNFYNEELNLFLEQTTGELRSIEGQFLPIDTSSIQSLRAALDVTPIFFGSDGKLRVEYIVTPLGMSGSLGRAILDFEGQLVISAHRASRGVQIIWPNMIGGPGSSRFDLFTNSANGNHYSKKFDGPWSWLKLYDDAQKTSLSGTSVDVVIVDSFGRDAYFRFNAVGTTNPFFNSPFDSFNLPSKMYVHSKEIMQ